MSRRTNQYVQETQTIYFAHAQATGDVAAAPFWIAPWPCQVVGVKYYNATGLATHADNWFNIKIQNDSAICAKWNTDTGVEGTIAAATPVDFTLGTTTDPVLAEDDVLSVVLTEGGTATLPAGWGFVEVVKI